METPNTTPPPKHGTAVCCYTPCSKTFNKKRASQVACSTRCRNRAWWERERKKAAEGEPPAAVKTKKSSKP